MKIQETSRAESNTNSNYTKKKQQVGSVRAHYPLTRVRAEPELVVILNELETNCLLFVNSQLVL